MGRRRNIGGGGPATLAIRRGRRRVLYHREDLSIAARVSRREAALSRHPAAVQRHFLETLKTTETDSELETN
jgi:hypothetical protein